MTEKPIFFKLVADGEVLAEMPVHIYDGAKAWKVFQAIFAVAAPAVVAEFFEAMRIACDPQLLADLGPKMGIRVELNPPPKPDIIVPNGVLNGARK